MRYTSPLRALWMLLPLWLFSFTDAAPTDGKYSTCVARNNDRLDNLLLVPSAASFYVRNVPGLHLEPHHPPLHIFSGHLPSDPNAADAPETEIIPHLFFFMIKNRRIADKERIIFWFNVRPASLSDFVLYVIPFSRVDKDALRSMGS